MLYVGFMASVRVMYWKEIPVQVQGMDESGQVSVPLDPRFQEGVDAIAMFDGSGGTDDYLMAWQWGDYADEPGSAKEAAAKVAERINAHFPKDFVGRVRDMERNKKRAPRPGAVDHWMER
ncbi:MAG: hypothetical protein FJ317_08925 [SAR202 cluster bacterium]|nr:hypothetical protein [SAR202 cluster bacterium]